MKNWNEREVILLTKLQKEVELAAYEKTLFNVNDDLLEMEDSEYEKQREYHWEHVIVCAAEVSSRH